MRHRRFLVLPVLLAVLLTLSACGGGGGSAIGLGVPAPGSKPDSPQVVWSPAGILVRIPGGVKRHDVPSHKLIIMKFQEKDWGYLYWASPFSILFPSPDRTPLDGANKSGGVEDMLPGDTDKRVGVENNKQSPLTKDPVDQSG